MSCHQSIDTNTLSRQVQEQFTLYYNNKKKKKKKKPLQLSVVVPALLPASGSVPLPRETTFVPHSPPVVDPQPPHLQSQKPFHNNNNKNYSDDIDDDSNDEYNIELPVAMRIQSCMKQAIQMNLVLDTILIPIITKVVQVQPQSQRSEERRVGKECRP